MTNLELFEPGAIYPERAGHKERGGTSQAAAEAIEAEGRGETLRSRVLAYYTAGASATPDMVALVLGESILAIRPRCSELRAQGLLELTGERRRSDGGRAQAVLRMVAP
jgi:hypothetical protein